MTTRASGRAGARAAFAGEPELFGRDEELAQVERAVRAGRRLATITGPPGVGKSALATSLVRRMGRQLPDRELRVLEADDDPTEIDRALAGIGGGTLLVVTVDTRPSQRGPVVHLAPLPVPREGDPPEAVAECHSVALFVDRCDRAGRRPDPGDLETVARICRDLGGWPLAIELAAARVRSLGLAGVADVARSRPVELSHPIPAHGHGTSVMPSMWATLGSTWARLAPAEQNLARAASMFNGAFTVAQLAQVAGTTTVAAADLVGALVDLAVVQWVDAPGDEPRLAMCHLVRAYVTTRFDRPRVRRELTSRYLGQVGGAAATVARAREENRPVFDHSPPDVELVAEVVHALTMLEQADDPRPALELAADAVAVLVRTPRHDWLWQQLDGLLRREGLPEDAVLGRALVGYAELVINSHDVCDLHALAIARWRRGIELLREHGSHRAVLQALTVILSGFSIVDDPELLAASVREGLALAEAEAAPTWFAQMELWAGVLAHQAGDVDEAVRLGASAIGRARRAGDTRCRLLCAMLLVSLPVPPRTVPGGLPDPLHLLDLAEQLGDVRTSSVLMTTMGAHAAVAGDDAACAQWCVRTLDIASLGDAWIAAGCSVMQLVQLAVRRDEDAQAALLHGTLTHRLDMLMRHLPPTTAQWYEHLVDALRSRLGPEEFSRGQLRGAILSWDEGIGTAAAYARGIVEEAPPECAPPGPVLPALTPREHQVLGLVIEGLDTRNIAASIGTSTNSVTHHIGAILAKLGVANRTQAAVWAVRNGYG